jgi:hypothetical protein
MNKKIILILPIAFLLLVNCSGDDDALSTPPDETKTAQILSFEFLKEDNDILVGNITGIIDQDKKEITVIFPANTLAESLVPSISVTEGVTITPDIDTPTNFTKAFVYTLSGKGFDKVSYTIKISFEGENSESKIKTFRFLVSDNPNANLKEDVQAELMENGSGVLVRFPAEVRNISALIPDITISQGATITPNTGVVQDFTETLEYMVTSDDGESKTTYTVISVIEESENDAINSFVITVNNTDYPATIEDQNITLTLPEGTALNNLSPKIGIGTGANVSPASGVAKDFTSTVHYIVTAENGSNKIYNVDVYAESSLKMDRKVLTDFYNDNLTQDNLTGPYLNWNLNAATMGDWTGVEIIDGRVSSLTIFASMTVYDFSGLAELSALKKLALFNTNIKEIPKEIGVFKTLEELNLSNNNIKTLPKEIGDMESLKSLFINSNEIIALPKELGNLGSLSALTADRNEIATVAREIGRLTNLTVLDLKENPITIIPREICELQRQNGGGLLSLIIDDGDTCEQ